MACVVIKWNLRAILRWSLQARIHTDFHRFTKIGQIFHNKYIFNNKKLSKLKSCSISNIQHGSLPWWNIIRRFAKITRGEWNWQMSCLNDLETQQRGLLGVKIRKISRYVAHSHSTNGKFVEIWNSLCYQTATSLSAVTLSWFNYCWFWWLMPGDLKIEKTNKQTNRQINKNSSFGLRNHGIWNSCSC